MRRKLILPVVATALYTLPALAEIPDTLGTVRLREAVVLAAPKENREIRETPTSVSLVSSDMVASARTLSIKGVSVPNLFIPQYGSKLSSSLYIRGIGSRINTPAVGLYIDGIPYIDKSSFDFSSYDISSIEVLRGPQTSLYGRNTMGGLIHVHSRSPFDIPGKYSLTAKLGAGNYGEDASLNMAVRTSGNTALSIGGFYSKENGAFRNVTLDRKDIDDCKSFGINVKEGWRVSPKWTLTATARYVRDRQNGWPYAYLGKRDMASEQLGDYIGKLCYNRENTYSRHLLDIGLNLGYKGRNFDMTAATAYQFLKDDMAVDQDFTPMDVYSLGQKQKIRTISEDVNFKSKGNGRWLWTGGVFAFYQALATDAPVTFFSDGIRMLERNIVIPQISVPMGAMQMEIEPRIGYNGETLPVGGKFQTPSLNLAVYHQSTLRDILGIRGLSAIAGIRLDYEKQRMEYLSTASQSWNMRVDGHMKRGGVTVRDISMLPQTVITPEDSRFEGSQSNDYLKVMPKFALQYDFPLTGNVYASVSRGFRSGGYNIQNLSEVQQSALRSVMMKEVRAILQDKAPEQYLPLIMDKIPEPGEVPSVKDVTLYKPEQAWNYELGTHLNLLKGRLKVDGALYLMQVRDRQISRFSGTGLGRETVNAGKSRSIGAEAEADWQLTDNFALRACYGFTQAKFTDYPGYNGNFVPFAPMHTVSGNARLTLPLRRDGFFERLTLSAGFDGRGKIYWNESNDAREGFHGSLSGRASVRFARRFELSLWGRNILDGRYREFWFESMGNAFAQYCRPARFGAELKFVL